MSQLTWLDDPRKINLTWVDQPAAYAFPHHRHADFWEIVVVTAGMMHHRLGGCEVIQRAGMVAIIRPGDHHALRASAVRFANCSAADALVAPVLAACLGRGLRSFLRRDEPLLGALGADAEAAIHHQLDDLDAADAPIRRVAAFLAILGLALGAVQRQPVPEPRPPWLDHALAQLEQAPLTVTREQFRRWCGVSAEHLARQVRCHLGCTPGDLLERRRLRAAARLLEQGQTVAAAATQTGYSDPGYFHRRFRRRHGIAPGHWRGRARRLA